VKEALIDFFYVLQVTGISAGAENVRIITVY
jgi:hypothetical protein